jgi:hypothetical protein
VAERAGEQTRHVHLRNTGLLGDLRLAHIPVEPQQRLVANDQHHKLPHARRSPAAATAPYEQAHSRRNDRSCPATMRLDQQPPSFMITISGRITTSAQVVPGSVPRRGCQRVKRSRAKRSSSRCPSMPPASLSGRASHGARPTAFTAAGAQAANSARTGSPTRIRGSRLAPACTGSSGSGTREPAPKGAQPCAMTARPSRKSPPPSM